MHAVADFLPRKTSEEGRRPEFHGEPARFDGGGDVKAWFWTLELIFDANGLNPEERFLHAIHCLAKSALKIYEDSHPTSNAQLCDTLSQRFSDKHDRFHKFSQLMALRQGAWGLDKYMEKLLELQTQVPDMSALDTLDIYLGGLEPTVQIHLLGSQHVGTLERALDESLC